MTTEQWFIAKRLKKLRAALRDLKKHQDEFTVEYAEMLKEDIMTRKRALQARFAELEAKKEKRGLTPLFRERDSAGNISLYPNV